MFLKPGVLVLLREPGHVQVGLRRPLAFTNLTTEEGQFLASLEGRAVAFSRAERENHGPIIDALDRHGLIEADRPHPKRCEFLVRVHGVDRITSELATGLALAGVSALSIRDRRKFRSGGLPSRMLSGLSDAAALTRLVRDSAPLIRIASPDEVASLEVLRAHGASDITLARNLTSQDIPHLEIVTDEEGVSIGPLIVPGVTPCETCLGISHTEHDPWWPRLAFQLGDPTRDAGVRIPPDTALLAAGIALREIMAFRRGGAPSSRKWRIAFGGNAIESESCAPHPACGCGAAAPETPPETAPRLL